MKYRRLGKTGLRVSVIGLGTWQFGGEWGKRFTPQEAQAILRRAQELGINLVDTAECYGDHVSEELIGQCMQHDRDNWILATKFGHKFHANFDRSLHWSPQEVRQQLEDSLIALRTDYVDLYQFHSGDDEAFDRENLWQMLGDQITAGKIRYLGVSISSRGDRFSQVERAGQVGASVVQLVYNRLDRIAEERILPSCREQGLGVMARVPLASGLLSGKYKPGSRFTDQNDVRSTHDEEKVQQRLRLVEEIQHKEVPQGLPMATWALAWCLQHPVVTCVIPGCKTVQQVEANAGAAGLDMVSDRHPQAVD